ncbi:hypothetical protein HK101_000525 [Irineochytrium annulatum]|nr:hypothetical protein HK101_000525 [Irineochytrium annulatum]
MAARAIFDCVADDDLELSFAANDIIVDITDAVDEGEGWLRGRVMNDGRGETGLFPANYVRMLTEKELEDILAEEQTPEPPPPALPFRPSSSSTSNNSGIPAPSAGDDGKIYPRPLTFDDNANVHRIIQPKEKAAHTRMALLEKSTALAMSAREKAGGSTMRDSATSAGSGPHRTRYPSSSSSNAGGDRGPSLKKSSSVSSNDSFSSTDSGLAFQRKRSDQNSNSILGEGKQRNHPRSISGEPAVPKRPPLLVSNQSMEAPPTPPRVDTPPPSSSHGSNSYFPLDITAADLKRAPAPRPKPSDLKATSSSTAPPPSAAPWSSSNTTSTSDAPRPSQIKLRSFTAPSASIPSISPQPPTPSDEPAPASNPWAGVTLKPATGTPRSSTTIKPSDALPKSNGVPAQSPSSQPSWVKPTSADEDDEETEHRLLKPSELLRKSSSNTPSPTTSAPATTLPWSKRVPQLSETPPSDQRRVASASASLNSSTRPKPPPPKSKPVELKTAVAAEFKASLAAGNPFAEGNKRQPPPPPPSKGVRKTRQPPPPPPSKTVRPVKHEQQSRGAIPPDVRSWYEECFDMADDDRDGLLRADEVRRLWLRSRLDNRTLGCVWRLADSRGRMCLDREEFW